MAETVKGLNIKLGLDTTELDSKLKDLNSDLKQQGQDLKAINNSLKYDTTNVELWRKKQATLNSILNDTKAKLEAQNARLEEAKKAVQIGAMSEDEFNKLKRGVMYTEAEVSKLNNELKNTSKKIDDLGNAKWDKLASVGSSLTKYVTGPIVGAVTALSALTVKSMNSADEIGDNASKVYLTAEAYQEWAHACDILAVDSTSMQKALVKVNGLLGDIANGNGDKVKDTLSKLGLTCEDLSGLDTDKAFSKLRDALSNVKDEATRTAIANELFGDKLGSELTQVLGATTAKINELRNETHELGIVTNEEAEIAGEFTDELSHVKQSLASVGTAIAVQVVPVISKLCDALLNKIIPALKKVIEWWSNLSGSLKATIGIIVGVVASIGPILTIVGKLIPMIKTVVTMVKSVSVASKLATAGWAGLIAVLAVILLQNEKFRGLLKEIFDALGKVLDTIMDLISNVVEALMPIIEAIIDVVNEIIDSLVDLLDQILDPIIDLLDVIIGLINNLIPVIKSIINELTNVLIPVINVIKKVLEPVMSIVKIIIDLVVKIIDVVTELIESVLGTIINIISVIGDILGVLIQLITTVIEIVGDVLEPVLQIIMAILEPIFEVIVMIIDVIAMVMELLSPLIDTLLQPLFVLLQAVFSIISALSPILKVIAQVIEAVICPVLEVLFAILKPILDILNAIIEAIKWVLDKVSGAFGWLGDLFGDIGNWFKDTFNIGGGNKSNTNNTTNNNVSNQITINTSSSTVDIDSLNNALGGSYL